MGTVTGKVESLVITTSAPDAQPAVGLVAGTATETTLSFTATLTDTDKAAYVCLEKSEGITIPSADKILQEGVAIAESGKVLVSDLKASTTYVIVAAAANGKIVSTAMSIEMTTLTFKPTVVLTKGSTGENMLTFNVVLTNSERAAYVCLEKSEGVTIPSADKIMQTGVAIAQSGEVTINGLKAETTYIIAVAAVNRTLFSEVASVEIKTDVSISGPAVFDRQAAGAYYGDTHDSGYGEYTFVLADGATSEVNGVYTTTGAGRAMSFDLYQFPPFSVSGTINVPARTYKYATTYGMNTFAPEKTFCMANDGKGNISKIEFKAGTIDVKMSGTTYTITANLTTTTDKAFTASYTGKLAIENKEEVPAGLPQIEKNITNIAFIRALAKYYSIDESSDNCVVNLYNVEPTISEGADYLNTAGHMVSLDLRTAVSAEMKLQEGVYNISDAETPGTYAGGYEYEFMGMFLPLGTYCEDRNANYESFYGYITTGTVTITKLAAANSYRFVLDFTTDKGYKISGTYEGLVELTDKRAASASTPASEVARTLKIRR